MKQVAQWFRNQPSRRLGRNVPSTGCFADFNRVLATFSAVFAITLAGSGLSGCAIRAGVEEEHYQQAITLVDRGTLMLRERQYLDARAAFDMAYELAPLAAAVDGLGCIALMEGRFEEAETHFSRAFQMDRTYDVAIGNLALLYDIRGNKEEAKRLYQWVLERRPDDPYIRNNLAALNYDLTEDKASLSNDLRKAYALGGHGVIVDNITRIGQ